MSEGISVGRPTIRPLGRNLAQSYDRDDLASGFQFQALAALLLITNILPVGLDGLGLPLVATVARFGLLILTGIIAVKLMMGLTTMARDSDDPDER